MVRSYLPDEFGESADIGFEDFPIYNYVLVIGLHGIRRGIHFFPRYALGLFFSFLPSFLLSFFQNRITHVAQLCLPNLIYTLLHESPN